MSILINNERKRDFSEMDEEWKKNLILIKSKRIGSIIGGKLCWKFSVKNAEKNSVKNQTYIGMLKITGIKI